MHRKLDILADTGYAVMRDWQGPPIAPAEWESLTYLDWKSGGDTNFAPLASATGELDCRGFWDHGKPDKDGIWTQNRELAPSLCRYVEGIGGNFGRVRVIKLNPSDEATALRQLHRDDNNRLNPDGCGWVVRSWLELDDTAEQSVFILREQKDDPATETRIALHPGMQLIIDTERLHHVVWHPGPQPRYALITSWESDDVIDKWISNETQPAPVSVTVPRPGQPDLVSAVQLSGESATSAPLRARQPRLPQRTGRAAGTARLQRRRPGPPWRGRRSRDRRGRSWPRATR